MSLLASSRMVEIAPRVVPAAVGLGCALLMTVKLEWRWARGQLA
jgi:hypothetical protein